MNVEWNVIESHLKYCLSIGSLGITQCRKYKLQKKKIILILCGEC